MLHSIQLHLRHQRTNLTFLIERSAKLDFPGPPPDTLHDSVKDFFLCIQARAGTTDLACITKNRHRGSGNRQFQIRVGKDDIG